jgi:hypothetical protein
MALVKEVDAGESTADRLACMHHGAVGVGGRNILIPLIGPEKIPFLSQQHLLHTMLWVDTRHPARGGRVVPCRVGLIGYLSIALFNPSVTDYTYQWKDDEIVTST